MLTNAALATLLTTNLNDDRLLSIQMYLTKLISRQVYGNGIPQYRIVNETTSTDITSLANFIAAISSTYVKPDYYYSASTGTLGDVIHPSIVILTNFTVTISEFSDEDDFYSTHSGCGRKRIAFILSYMNDSEALKISEIKLLNMV